MKSSPTQDFVQVKEIRDGIVIMNDGSLRAILMASSLNFALKSEDIQQAILLQFQNFLNSLDFSAQIVVSSRRLDIRPYLALLDGRLKEQNSDLMKTQVREYIDFIKGFTENTNIMSKTFFIVVSYSPAIFTGKDVKGKFLPKFGIGKREDPKTESETFEENRSQLEERIAVVEQGIIRTGVRVVQLGTEEVVELFYKMLNPGESEKPIPTEQDTSR